MKTVVDVDARYRLVNQLHLVSVDNHLEQVTVSESYRPNRHPVFLYSSSEIFSTANDTKIIITSFTNAEPTR